MRFGFTSLIHISEETLEKPDEGFQLVFGLTVSLAKKFGTEGK